MLPIVFLAFCIAGTAALGFLILSSFKKDIARVFTFNGLGEASRPEWSLGYLYLPALFGIVAASVCTAPLGAKIAHALPVDKLKKVFALFLYVVATRMLWKLVG